MPPDTTTTQPIHSKTRSKTNGDRNKRHDNVLETWALKHKIIKLADGLSIQCRVHGRDCDKDFHFGKAKLDPALVKIALKRWVLAGYKTKVGCPDARKWHVYHVGHRQFLTKTVADVMGADWRDYIPADIKAAIGAELDLL